MKRVFVLPLAAALLVLSGCTDTTTDTTPGSTITGSIFGTQHESAERYDRMLQNGRVHDRDGFLLDGENSRYDTLS